MGNRHERNVNDGFVSVDSTELKNFKKKILRIPSAWGWPLDFPEKSKIIAELVAYKEKQDGDYLENVYTYRCTACSEVLPTYLGFFARANNHSDKGLLCPHLRKYLANKE